jgi:hypothetical protein
MQTQVDHATRDEDDLRSGLEYWFTHHGVPHFDGHYTGGTPRAHVLICLATIVALEVGVISSRELSPRLFAFLLVAVPLIVLFLEPMFSGARERARWRWLIPAALLLPGALLLPFRHVDAGLLDPDPWIDFALLLGALVACIVAAERVAVPRPSWHYRGILVLLFAANVWCILDGGVVEPLSHQFDRVLEGAAPGLTPIPPATPALLGVLAALFLILRTQTPEDDCGAEPQGYAAAMVAPLIVLFGIENTYVARLHGGGWEVPIAVLAMLFIVARGPRLSRALSQNLNGERIQLRRPRGLEPSSQRWFVLCAAGALLAYPVWVAVSDVRDGEHTVGAPLWAFAVTLLSNMALLAIGWAMLALGVHTIVKWALPEIWRRKWDLLGGVVKGLPLLLVFSVFLLQTAEVWQVVVTMSDGELILMTAMPFALAIALMVIMTGMEVADASDLKSWDDVSDATESYLEDADESFRSLIDESVRNASRRRAEYQLDKPCRGERLNARFVALVYQSALFVPIAVASTLAFLVIGHLTVSAEVAGEWIYGDTTSAATSAVLARDAAAADPWPKVAVLLGGFSTLYLVANLFESRDEKNNFFKVLRTGLRTRFAVRAVYRTLYPPDREPPPQLGPPGPGRNPVDGALSVPVALMQSRSVRRAVAPRRQIQKTPNG